MPVRIQLSRKKGYRKPEGVIVVSRPSKWATRSATGPLTGSPVYRRSMAPSGSKRAGSARMRCATTDPGAALVPLSVVIRTSKWFHHRLGIPRKHDDLCQSAHRLSIPALAPHDDRVLPAPPAHIDEASPRSTETANYI